VYALISQCQLVEKFISLVETWTDVFRKYDQLAFLVSLACKLENICFSMLETQISLSCNGYSRHVRLDMSHSWWCNNTY